jgi:hypothetical protein
MTAGYARSGDAVAVNYPRWTIHNTVAYVSATHGSRYVNNYANATAKAYRRFEKAGKMPAGSVLAKDSFLVNANGTTSAGPLFVMEKMAAGFNAESGDWRYTMIMPDGSVFGTTKGAGTAKVEFCNGCHAAVAEDADYMMFIPDEYRVKF